MYERLTDRARKVMQLANQEALRFNHEYVGTEHILLGLVKEGSGVAACVLKRLGGDFRKIYSEVEKLVQSGPKMVAMGKLPPTPRAKKVIEYSVEEARSLKHDYVDTEHILLGLLREREGAGAQVLLSLGLKPQVVRDEVFSWLGCRPDGGAAPALVDSPLAQRFTDRARKVMQLANQEAQRFNHEYIGTEHILLGLVKEGSGVAANVLKNLDIDLRKIRLEVEKLVQSGPEMVTMGKLPQTPRAKKVIEYSMEEARNLNHNYVGTEHILLGLLREQEGVAAQVLMNLGLKAQTVRDAVLRLLACAPHGGPTREAVDSPRPHDASSRRGAGGRRSSNEAPPPASCPQCAGSRIVRVLWNRVRLSGQDKTDIDAGHAILGGPIQKEAPAWACLDCAPDWLEVHRLGLQDYQWQRAKEAAVCAYEFETAARLRDRQNELRPQLAALVDKLLNR